MPTPFLIGETPFLKKINSSWKDVSGHFSSNKWKGGRIDGWVSPRTGTSDRIVLTHCTGHTSRLRLVGARHGRCARVMAGGLEMLVLEGANARSVAGSGCESFAGVRCTGFVNGDCPWDLSLGQHTGNEEI